MQNQEAHRSWKYFPPAEKPTKHGLIYAATPASDIVCGPCQLASGITLQVFMTGRGTPYGLAAAPVIKVCSRNEMKAMWQDLIDVNAGPIATGEATIQEIGTQLFNKIIAVASGKDQSFAEKYKLHNDLCIFNPGTDHLISRFQKFSTASHACMCMQLKL